MVDDIGSSEQEAAGYIPRHLRSWLHPSERRLVADETPELASRSGLVDGHGA